MKEDMSALDVRACVRELRGMLKGARVDKAYEPEKGELLLRVRTAGSRAPDAAASEAPRKQDVSLQVGKAVHLTNQPRENPEKPSSFVMQLRKHLGNAFIDDVRQHGFDRVVEFVSHRKDGTYVLVVELFRDGNVVLVKDDRILTPLFHQSWAHREIRPGVEWVPPPARIDPGAIGEEEFFTRMRGSTADVVRTLATEINLGGAIAEEVCAQAGVSKKLMVADASDEDLRALLTTMRAIMERIENGPLDPVVVKKGDQKVDVSPFPFRAHEGLELERFPTFQEALDAFFGKAITVERVDPRLKKLQEEKAKVQRMLDAQRAALVKFDREEAESKRKGDLLYAHFDTAQRITQTLWNAGKSLGWKEVQEKLKEGRKQGNPDAELVESINGNEGTAMLSLPDEQGNKAKVRVDLRKTVQENADAMYENSKKMRDKRKGALEAMAKTEARMKELEERGVEIVQAIEEQQQRLPPTKRFWFENYRWFYTSDNHLVVAGRDVKTNEKVVSKNLEDKDRYLHADVSGAPSTVVKAKDGEVSETALEEAAAFAASMSRIWSAGHASGEAYWVTPEQVSKTPNPGEYVAKGSFIIRGKRNFIRVPIRLAVGEVEIDGHRKVMSGPVPALAARSQRYVVLEPGREPTNQVANRIAQALDVNVEEVQTVMPPASVSVVEAHGIEI